MDALIVSPLKLPNAHDETFWSSSFFRQGANPSRLPIPAEVRAQGLSQNGVKSRKWRPPPAIFHDLNLLVKYGGGVSITEGQCLWMIRSYLGHEIPVPEVYGWCQDETQTFIFMELIKGSTLKQRWEDLSATERSGLCDQLRPMVLALQTLSQDLRKDVIGNIVYKPVQDIIFDGYIAGPFPSTSAFNDWFSQPNWNQTPSNQSADDADEWRRGLPNDPIRFVHSDLNQGNIMITPEGIHPPRILAIIDWGQSGWYPAFWEYCKARWTGEPNDDWVTKYISMFILSGSEAWDSFNFYCYRHGQ